MKQNIHYSFYKTDIYAHILEKERGKKGRDSSEVDKQVNLSFLKY